jgi:hypothetical protein
MDWLGSFAEWWNVDRALVAINGVLGLAAVLTAVVAIRSFRQQARDSTARSRPVVVADFIPTPYTTSIALVVRNYGQSTARNLMVTFDPPLPTAERASDGERSIVPFIVRRYSKPITVLPPGRELSNVYYVGAGESSNAEGVPDQVTVLVTYRDDQQGQYTDVFPLDVDLVRNGTESTGSRSPERQLAKGVEHLKAVSTAVTKISREIPDVAAVLAGRDPWAERAAEHAALREQHERLVARVQPSRGPTTEPAGREAVGDWVRQRWQRAVSKLPRR